MTTARRCNVAVIGAGAAGLVTAHELLRQGHTVKVFEQSNRVGGLWNYEEAVESDPLGQRPERRIHGSLSKHGATRTGVAKAGHAFPIFIVARQQIPHKSNAAIAPAGSPTGEQHVTTQFGAFRKHLAFNLATAPQIRWDLKKAPATAGFDDGTLYRFRFSQIRPRPRRKSSIRDQMTQKP